MFAIGDIVEIYSPVAGYNKYHLCVLCGGSAEPFQFLFLNSDPNYGGSYVVDCSRVPCLPPSETGKTVFSFTMVPRYSVRQLQLFKANKKGELASDLARELFEFAKTVPTLTSGERTLVLAALAQI